MLARVEFCLCDENFDFIDEYFLFFSFEEKGFRLFWCVTFELGDTIRGELSSSVIFGMSSMISVLSEAVVDNIESSLVA